MPRLAVIVPLSLAFLIGGCSLIVNPEDHPTRCKPEDADSCPPGFRCRDLDGEFRCERMECFLDEDCGEGFYCFEARCHQIQCHEDDDCDDDGLFCFHYRCEVAQCSEEEPCGAGFLCINHFCIEGQCAKSEDCDLNFFCEDNLCVPGCDSEARCPEGQLCYEGQCRTPRPETCNGLDDDLDGYVDNNLDRDNDGYSACESDQGPPDCNDYDENSHPGAEEVCDGADNDCNGDTDDGACRRDEVCIPTEGDVWECYEPLPDSCLFVPCEDDEYPFCNTGSGECEPYVDIGERCVTDDQCTAGICLNTTSYLHHGRHCVELCCSSDDCGGGTWCVENGTGFRFCAPFDWFPEDEVECTYSDKITEVEIINNTCETCFTFAERSLLGRLLEQGLCRPKCCRDSDCTGSPPRRCQLVNAVTSIAEDVAVAVCNAYEVNDGDPGYEDNDRYDLCPENPDLCASGLHWEIDGQCRCASPCCDDDDCRVDGHDSAVCALSPSGWNQCYDPDQFHDLTGGFVGTECTPGQGLAQCQSGTCHPTGGYCTTTCCPDFPCGGASMRCRPTDVGSGRYANICTRNSDVD